MYWLFTLPVFQMDVTPSCELVYYLMKCLLLTISFVAKWYKLWKRQTVYNANFVIAKHFERCFEENEREQFERQLAEKSDLVEHYMRAFMETKDML